MEAQFHGVANATALRQLHANQDWNGLLEYALLLADAEASQHSQIKWLMGEIMLSRGIQEWHLNLAQELLARGD